jgi:hypothetical protein
MKLMELHIAANEKLTNEQRSILLKIYQAQQISTEAATEIMKGDIKAMAAGEFLVQQRMINVTADGVKITQLGVKQLADEGLIDSFKLTPAGIDLINQK